MVDPMSDAPQRYRRLGKYELHQLLGEGAMGIVWKAYDTVLRRYVALKLLSASFRKTKDMHERFLREARAAGAIRHADLHGARTDHQRRDHARHRRLLGWMHALRAAVLSAAVRSGVGARRALPGADDGAAAAADRRAVDPGGARARRREGDEQGAARALRVRGPDDVDAAANPRRAVGRGRRGDAAARPLDTAAPPDVEADHARVDEGADHGAGRARGGRAVTGLCPWADGRGSLERRSCESPS